MGTLPVLGQTETSLPSLVIGQTGAHIVAVNNGGLGPAKMNTDSMYIVLPAPGERPARFSANRTTMADLMWDSPKITGRGGLIQEQTQGQVQSQTPAQPQTSEPAAATAPSDSLTWHGITFYGAYDIGLGFVTHGLPENGYNYEGASLVNRNGYQHRFLVAPNNIQQTGLGIRGKVGYYHGWSVVFNGSTGINPQSGLLANASATQTINNGLPRSSYSYAIDGARAGQPFNDEFYGGITSTNYGTLTFGRQRALGTDLMLLYDPAGGSYAFSYIGYNGIMAGGGERRIPVRTTPSSTASPMARFTSARCTSLPTGTVAAIRPLPPGLPQTARRNQLTTTRMDSTSAETMASCLRTSSINTTTRPSAC